MIRVMAKSHGGGTRVRRGRHAGQGRVRWQGMDDTGMPWIDSWVVVWRGEVTHVLLQEAGDMEARKYGSSWVLGAGRRRRREEEPVRQPGAVCSARWEDVLRSRQPDAEEWARRRLSATRRGCRGRGRDERAGGGPG